MGKKKDQPTSSPSKRPTPPSAPLEVEGTPVEDRSAKGKRRSDGAGASPSAPPHQEAKEATAEPEGKHQKKEKKEKRARKEKAETPAAEAEGDRDDGEKKEKKHKKSKAAQDSASIAASLSGYAAGDLSKSLFGGESAAVEPAALFSAIPEAPPYPTMESSDEEDDDSGSDGARNNEDAEVLKLRREEEEEREEKHNREKLGRTVFVGNVPVETDRKELQKLFKAYGEVESVRLRSVALAKESLLSYRKAGVLSKQFHPSRSTCNAYVVFTSRDMAEEALALNNHLLDGRHLHVDLADSDNKYAEADNSIFVGNLPFDAEEEDVRAHFASCGDIEYVRLVRDKETNIGKGIGYVNFKDRDGVAAALLMHGHQYKNRELRVFAAKSRKVEQRRAPRGGRGGRGGSSPGRGRGGAPSRGGERGRGGFRGGRGGGDVAERGRGGFRGGVGEGRGGFRGRGDSEGRGGFRGRGDSEGRGGFRGGRGGFRGGDRGGRGGFGGERGGRGGFGGGERGGFRGGRGGFRGGERGGRGGFRGGRGGAGGAGFGGPERRIAKEPREPAVARRREVGESFEGKRSEPGVVPRLKRPTKDPHKAAGAKKRAPRGK